MTEGRVEPKERSEQQVVPRSAPGRPPQVRDQEDVLLMTRVALGDTPALTQLYERHAGWALAVATRLIGSQEEAEEIVQETFLELWRRAGQYSPERAAPAPWIATLLRSRALDRRRKRSAALRASEVDQQLATSEPHRAADELLAAHHDVLRVRTALGLLTPEQRVCVELAWLEGLSHSEVASRTGIPLGTVKTRIRMALTRLSSELRALL